MKPTIVAPAKYEEKEPLPEVVTVPMMSPTMPGVIAPRPKWSWCHFWMSLFASLFCWFPGMICGVTGLYHSILSYVDHKTGDFPRATRKRRCAYGCTTTAIVLGAICWALIIAGTVMFWRHHHLMIERTIDLGQPMRMRQDYEKKGNHFDMKKEPYNDMVTNKPRSDDPKNDHDSHDHDDDHHRDRHHDRHHDGGHKYPRPEPMP